VIKDPHSAGTEADIAAQQQLLQSVRRDLGTAIDLVNSAELVRGQINNLKNLTQDTELRRAADELDQKLVAVEGLLVELRTTGAGRTASASGRSWCRSSGISQTACRAAISNRPTSTPRCRRISRIASGPRRGRSAT
jgi:hypothetical protein